MLIDVPQENDTGEMMHDLIIPADDVSLYGDLFVPEDPLGLVIFAHGSGSSRHSPRNQSVAQKLQAEGFATLLADLLTEEEELVDTATAEHRFDISMLTERLVGITKYMKTYAQTELLTIGYFGASTGAAAALGAAAQLSDNVRAVVSRGGRPDLTEEKFLAALTAPVLLLVGSLDETVYSLNHKAMQSISSQVKELKVIEGATHLFEEPGKLGEVAEAAAEWFLTYVKV
ncbi:MAG TPA: dienelactone hydrolase family protein [Patescibacteria group bacterium]|nr:dienelactone hydrolase family protein [Patescibacteria group bacterium]